MNRPSRIQLRRTKGWRKPEGAVVVSRPSAWGNPFPIGGFLMGNYVAIAVPIDRALSVELHRAWVDRMLDLGRLDLSPLRGRDLACWCPPDVPCHADTLIEAANR